MEPVINPWFFYFASVANSVIIVSKTACFLLAIICTGLMIGFLCESGYYGEEEKKEIYEKWLVKCVKALVVCAMLSIFLPSKQTLIQMVVAKNVTVDLVGQTADAVTQVYNDIIGLFNGGGGS